jgi:diguanylate cyclase (GGDEF)-like protein
VVIPQLIRVVPEAVWLALAASLGLAGVGTGAAVFFGRRARRQAGRMAEAEAAALTDQLTGVLNRRGFTEAVERELARSTRYSRPFVLAYIDVRGLKGVNDSEGHLAGDQLLRGAASVLTASARAHDVIGRLGGDEFGILLAEQSADDADVITDRIREQVEVTRDALGFQAYWDLTVGTAAFPEDGLTTDELLAVADRRLYEQRGIEIGAVR